MPRSDQQHNYCIQIRFTSHSINWLHTSKCELLLCSPTWPRIDLIISWEPSASTNFQWFTSSIHMNAHRALAIVRCKSKLVLHLSRAPIDCSNIAIPPNFCPMPDPIHCAYMYNVLCECRIYSQHWPWIVQFPWYEWGS